MAFLGGGDSAIGVRHMKRAMRLLDAMGYSAIGGPKPPDPLCCCTETQRKRGTFQK